MDIVDKILSVSNRELDSINMEVFNEITSFDVEYQTYFKRNSGIEHYRLLVYIANLIDDTILFDIGTQIGYSAIALGSNPKNQVISYDIKTYPNVDNSIINKLNKNIHFKLGNFLKLENVHCTNFILLDTVHDGTSELEVINYLKNEKWKGVMLLDDIHAFYDLNAVWNSLDLIKYDITSKGHWSGTGLVVFE